MGVALVITIVYIIAVYLVFFRFKWLKFSIVWGVVSFWIGFHLMLIFMIGLRFYAPFTVDAHLIRNTIQIIPRLTQPTILTEVVVEPNVPVKKGDPLYRFDQTVFARHTGAVATIAHDSRYLTGNYTAKCTLMANGKRA